MRLIPAAVLLLLSPGAGAETVDLLTAYRRALTHDPLYLASKAAAQADAKEVGKALGGLLPGLGFTAAVSRNDTENTVTDSRGVDTTSRLYYYSQSYALSLRQPLYRHQSWAAYRQAKAVAERSWATLEQDEQAAALRAAVAYFEALYADSSLRAEASKREAFERTYELTERAVKAGAATMTDLYEVQARRDLAAAAELEARATRDNALSALASLTGGPIEALAPVEPASVSSATEPGAEAEWLARAERGSRVLAALRAEVEASRQERSRAFGAHLPMADLVLSHRRATNELDFLLNRGTKTSLVGLQVSVPLFSGGGAHAAVVQARLRVERAERRLDAGRREVELAVRREHANVRLAAARVAALSRALASVEQSLVGTQKGVQAGTRTVLDVLNAHDQVERTRAELAKAGGLFVLSYLRLEDAAGGLGEPAVSAANRWLSLSR